MEVADAVGDAIVVGVDGTTPSVNVTALVAALMGVWGGEEMNKYK